MGRRWDATGVAFDPGTWAAVLRVLKPGGHLLAFGGSRTYHRMACAVEDAGFEVRDQIMWVYASGFPKSLDVGKAIDRAGVAAAGGCTGSGVRDREGGRAWRGWGTALKPAHEPIVVARKPLDGTVAGNVLRHGTGALNVGGCRVPSVGGRPRGASRRRAAGTRGGARPTSPPSPAPAAETRPGGGRPT